MYALDTNLLVYAHNTASSFRDIGQEILDGLREIKAHKEGKVDLRKRALVIVSAKLA